MIGNVLCAVDISDAECDDAVLRAAHRMAQLDGLGLDVLTVVPDFGKSLVAGFFEKEHHSKMVTATKRALNNIVSGAIGEEANRKVRHVVATGSAYEEILKLAKETGASLIVIGAHKPDFADYLLGPNSARVVRHATCSVFVVR